jgi:hypothetical protein
MVCLLRRGANSCAYCLRIREEISSGPVALDGSSLLSSFSVPLAVTVISGIDGQGENIICYDENSEKVQKQKNSGIIYETPRKTAQELHL